MSAINTQPHLLGELVELRPLVPDDWDALFAVASDPLIWEQHPASNRYQEPVFREFFQGALASGGALVVLDRKTQAIIGSSRYFGHDAIAREIEIGWTFLARKYWGGAYNADMKRLMVGHILRHVDRVIFQVGITNFRSRRAMEKVGAIDSGEIRRTPQPDGRILESVVYEIRRQV